VIRFWRSFPPQFAQVVDLLDLAFVLDIESSLPVPLRVDVHQALTVIPRGPFCKITSQLRGSFLRARLLTSGLEGYTSNFDPAAGKQADITLE